MASDLDDDAPDREEDALDDDQLDDDEPEDRGPRDATPRPRDASRVGTPFRLVTFGLLIVIGSLLGSVVFRWIGAIVHRDPPPAEVVEVRPTPDVITAVRDLARLETTSYHVERVIDLTSRQSRLFGLIQAEDSILLVAASDVVAGVDLSDLREGDVTVDQDASQVIITLPPPRIFSARLDNDLTYVYGRRTDALARRRENLETRARQEAERTLEQAAIEAGILERARTNAERTVAGLVRSLGYDDVVIRFRDQEL